MRRRVPGDMARVRRIKKIPYPLRNAPLVDQIEAAWRMYQEYSEHGGNVITTDQEAFTAGLNHVFGWIEAYQRGKYERSLSVAPGHLGAEKGGAK